MNAIIRGQHVRPEKLEKAKELRQEMTPSEQLLWNHLRSNRLNGLHFRRQQVIEGYIADFYCHSARLIVEVDGAVHYLQKKADLKRELALKNKGLKILRIKNDDINANLQKVLQLIINACGK